MELSPTVSPAPTVRRVAAAVAAPPIVTVPTARPPSSDPFPPPAPAPPTTPPPAPIVVVPTADSNQVDDEDNNNNDNEPESSEWSFVDASDGGGSTPVLVRSRQGARQVRSPETVAALERAMLSSPSRAAFFGGAVFARGAKTAAEEEAEAAAAVRRRQKAPWPSSSSSTVPYSPAVERAQLRDQRLALMADFDGDAAAAGLMLDADVNGGLVVGAHPDVLDVTRMGALRDTRAQRRRRRLQRLYIDQEHALTLDDVGVRRQVRAPPASATATVGADDGGSSGAGRGGADTSYARRGGRAADNNVRHGPGPNDRQRRAYASKLGAFLAGLTPAERLQWRCRQGRVTSSPSRLDRLLFKLPGDMAFDRRRRRILATGRDNGTLALKNEVGEHSGGAAALAVGDRAKVATMTSTAGGGRDRADAQLFDAATLEQTGVLIVREGGVDRAMAATAGLLEASASRRRQQRQRHEQAVSRWFEDRRRMVERAPTLHAARPHPHDAKTHATQRDALHRTGFLVASDTVKPVLAPSYANAHSPSAASFVSLRGVPGGSTVCADLLHSDNATAAGGAVPSSLSATAPAAIATSTALSSSVMSRPMGKSASQTRMRTMRSGTATTTMETMTGSTTTTLVPLSLSLPALPRVDAAFIASRLLPWPHAHTISSGSVTSASSADDGGESATRARVGAAAEPGGSISGSMGTGDRVGSGGGGTREDDEAREDGDADDAIRHALTAVDPHATANDPRHPDYARFVLRSRRYPALFKELVAFEHALAHEGFQPAADEPDIYRAFRQRALDKWMREHPGAQEADFERAMAPWRAAATASSSSDASASASTSATSSTPLPAPGPAVRSSSPPSPPKHDVDDDDARVLSPRRPTRVSLLSSSTKENKAIAASASVVAAAANISNISRARAMAIANKFQQLSTRSERD